MEENTQSSKTKADKEESIAKPVFSATSGEVGVKQADKADDIAKNKIFAALSYVWLVSIFILLLKKESAFAKFHAKQGFILAIASIVLGWIPVLGWILVLIVFVFEIIGFIKALQGEYYKLPLVEKLAEKMNF